MAGAKSSFSFFFKKVSRIGPSVEGHEVLHTMLNGGKTNSSGNLYYGGAAAHINPLLDLGFAKGIISRFTDFAFPHARFVNRGSKSQ